MYNPFREEIRDEERDELLIEQSLQGNRPALERLILRHQSWIYNIALRMVFDSNRAEDITQDVLIKVITSLGRFDPSKGAFRTWMYRIAVNHIINTGKGERETAISDYIRNYGAEDFQNSIPDTRSLSRPDRDLIMEEIKLSCVLCVIILLDKRERMVFILGAIFSVSDRVGSEICDMSRDNFRQILSRTRKKVFEFFRTHCGLYNEKNPCRCEHHLGPMIESRLVDPEDLLVKREARGRIKDVLTDSVREIEDSYYEYRALVAEQPFLEPGDMTQWLRDLFSRDEVRGIFSLH